MYDSKLPWTWCMWAIIHAKTVYFHGVLDLSDWDKLFSNVPVKLCGRTVGCMVASWKVCYAKLVWQGRIQYTGNSLSVENVHWSFIFHEPPALVMDHRSRCLFKKGIVSISHTLDSEGIFLGFSMAKSRFYLGKPYRTAWHQVCCFVFKVQVPSRGVHYMEGPPTTCVEGVFKNTLICEF